MAEPATPTPAPAPAASPARPVAIEIPKIKLDMPPPPLTPDGKPADTILDKDGRKRAFEHFEDMFARANQPAPTLADFHGDMAAYKIARQAYNQNPLSAAVQGLNKNFASNVASQGVEDATKIYQADAQALAARYMEGVDKGAEDPSVNQDRQGAFQQLISGHPLQAIMTFIKTIPFVGDMIKSIMRWAQSKFSGEGLSFEESRAAVNDEKALAGGEAALGIKGVVQDARLRASAGTHATATDANGKVALDAEFNQETINHLPPKVKEKVMSLQSEGKIVMGEAGKPALATADAVTTVDGLLQEYQNVMLPKHKAGKSIAAEK